MPQILTAPLFTTFLGGAATTYSIGSILAYAAVTVVSSAVLQALAPKPSVSQGLTTNGIGAAQPHEYVYGRVRKGGTITYIESTGDKNKYLHMILCLAGHRIDAVEDIYIDDEIVTVDPVTNMVTTDKWTKNGTPKIRIKEHLGSTTQTVDTDLLAESSQITADFRGRNIAYLYIRLEYDKDVFQNGLPTFTAVIRGKRVYNPATSVTEWTANSALCIRDYLTSAIGLSDPLVDDTFFIAASAECDTIVPTSSGSQKRYETHGVLSSANSIGSNLDTLLTSCAGTLFWGTGGWKLKVGAWTPPVKNFTLDNLRSGINLRTMNPTRDNFNIVQGTFNDAAQDYIAADFPSYKSETFIDFDNGFEAPLDITLGLTTDSAMAQRIAKLTLLRGREQMAFDAEFDLSAMGVQVGDNVTLDFDRYGWGGVNAKAFEVVSWKLLVDSTSGEIRIGMSLKETSEAAFDWDASDTDILANNTTLVDPRASLDISNFVATSGRVIRKDGTVSNYISLSWDSPENLFVTHYAVGWRESGSSDNFETSTTENQNYRISPVNDEITYELRVAAVTEAGFVGPYTTTTRAITGDTLPPTAPTGRSATGGFQSITLRWTNPTVKDFSHVEIWENTVNNSSTATLIATHSGNKFTVSNLPNLATRWYFLKSVDFSGNASAFPGGVTATTLQVVRADVVTGGVSGQSYLVDTSTVADPGTYGSYFQFSEQVHSFYGSESSDPNNFPESIVVSLSVDISTYNLTIPTSGTWDTQLRWRVRAYLRDKTTLVETLYGTTVVYLHDANYKDGYTFVNFSAKSGAPAIMGIRRTSLNEFANKDLVLKHSWRKDRSSTAGTAEVVLTNAASVVQALYR